MVDMTIVLGGFALAILIMLGFYIWSYYRKQGINILEYWKYIVGFIAVLVAAFYLVAYGISGVESGWVQTTATEAVSWVSNTINDFFGNIERLSNPDLFGTTDTSKGKKIGVYLDSLESLVGDNPPAGERMSFQYHVTAEIPESQFVNAKLICTLKDKDSVKPEITPTTISFVPGSSTSDVARCILSKEDTKSLKGPTTIQGSLAFDFKTETLLPVYFTSKVLIDSLAKRGTTFAKEYSMGSTQNEYKGEPVEVALSASQQPVILGEEAQVPKQMIAMILSNKWGGSAKIKNIQIYLPKGISISEFDTLCPFKKEESFYSVNLELLNKNEALINETSKNPILAEKLLRLECYFDNIDQDFISGSFEKKNYKVLAEYEFQSKPVEKVVNVK
ncbi:hypothetical protein J4468_04985 [Candidatus Woesearchaeota archaeon]|nr:hypothetical protein [Candidatus Woesearchaeota archaeon]